MLIVTHEMNFAREVLVKSYSCHQGNTWKKRNKPSQVFGAPKSERCKAFLSQCVLSENTYLLINKNTKV